MGTFKAYVNVKEAEKRGLDLIEFSIISPIAFDSHPMTRAGYAHLFQMNAEGEEIERFESNPDYRIIIISGN